MILLRLGPSLLYRTHHVLFRACQREAAAPVRPCFFWQSDAGVVPMNGSASLSILNTLKHAFCVNPVGPSFAMVPEADRAAVCDETIDHLATTIEKGLCADDTRVNLPQVYRDKARLHACVGDFEAVANCAEAVAEHADVDDADAWFWQWESTVLQALVTQRDDPEAAHQQLQVVYDHLIETNGGYHLFLEDCLRVCACSAAFCGKFDAALAAYEHMLAAHGAVIGPTAPGGVVNDTLWLRSCLAVLHMMAGDDDRAIDLCRENISLMTAAFGPQSIQVAFEHANMAALSQGGHVLSSVQHDRTAHDLCVEQLGAANPLTLMLAEHLTPEALSNGPSGMFPV